MAKTGERIYLIVEWTTGPSDQKYLSRPVGIYSTLEKAMEECRILAEIDVDTLKRSDEKCNGKAAYRISKETRGLPGYTVHVRDLKKKTKQRRVFQVEAYRVDRNYGQCF